MSLLTRLKEMWGRHDERLVQEGLDAQAAESDTLPVASAIAPVPTMGGEPTEVQQAAKEAVEAESPQAQEQREFGTEI